MTDETIHIEVDEDLCVGTGDCVRIAPLAFALDTGDRTARVLPTATEADVDDLVDAAMNCPTQAIRVQQNGKDLA